MKKVLLFAIVAMLSIQMASAGDVWISTSTSATKYHKVKDCPGLQNTTATIKKVTESEAKNVGRTKCARCWTDAVKSSTTKTTKKTTAKKTTETKAAEKKTTAKKSTATKKSTTKKATAEKETKAKKATPARDENGRFISTKKASDKTTAKESTSKAKKETTTKAKKETTKKKSTKKSTPARDEKGRFIKQSAE